MKIAAIDIGSNSIKLIVVDAAASDSFAVLAREKDMVRLGHDTLQQGRLSAGAIDRAVECVKRFRSIAEAVGHTEVLDTRAAIKHWKAHGLDLSPIITHHYAAEDYEAAFATMLSGRSGKVILDWI